MNGPPGLLRRIPSFRGRSCSGVPCYVIKASVIGSQIKVKKKGTPIATSQDHRYARVAPRHRNGGPVTKNLRESNRGPSTGKSDSKQRQHLHSKTILDFLDRHYETFWFCR